MIRTALDVIAVARSRGLEIKIDEGPPRMPVLVRPAGVDRGEITDALLDALKAWRLEIMLILRNGEE